MLFSPNALRNGFLTLWLVVLVGCQTTTGPTGQSTAIKTLPAPSAAGSADSAQTTKPRWRVPQQVDEPRTLWTRIRDGFLLDPTVEDNPRVDQQRLFFASQPRYFEITSKRAQRYLHYVVEELDKRDMPLELALLPFVESGYNPMAYSTSHAAGIWQFIPSTGRVFALRQDDWYDGRRDITASTTAALDYLSKLSDMFEGDWLLAVAAYNCGEGCVGRAVKRNQALGLPADYWNLQLPRETMNYVPKLLALAQIINSPEEYGTVLPSLDDTPYFAQITIKRPLDLVKAAELASISTDEMKYLNPAFKHRVATPNGPYQLLIPVNQAEQFSSALAQLPESERVSFTRYTVRRGDTLSQIARRHNLSVGMLRQANEMQGSLINIGQTLIVPHGPSTQLASANVPEKRTYTVKSGDSLYSIARRFNVEIKQLRAWNGVDTHLRPGQQLTLRMP
ncbi:lytic transglycosylase [Pseudomonas sp. G11-1]|uniref:LysM peptidoglycan-binding domain-containing protein n=1 Tax=Halopseudomonas bauzanensis TaxID=653930 RepID=A0A4U0YLE7_9GAMM|nr:MULTISPECIES: LysM peptidoglycan-binding domain-containing protein [Halopseudomonas]MCO5786009.1 lytic transglycosylase [Pseudomonas sp. G11-1]MCO5789235.1 lytic transglycosylase [Pseudomonas sp. G11-2]TKA90301.1 LysM peptidoglycan-binding domain-containing protein [Halopseudomonas bauzanensis]WGK63029.1 LysM peptidoglycan-binding domain-containing protein [Halopseudomonas sp. SMJS2]